MSIEPLNFIFIIDTLLGRMGWRKVSIVGHVNKIWKHEEGEDQGATPSSNPSEILQQFTRHGITLSNRIKVSGPPSLGPDTLCQSTPSSKNVIYPFGGRPRLLNGTRVNHALVKEGWCCWRRKYAPGDVTLEQLEAEAREARKDLWADPHPVPPWEWRKLHKSSFPVVPT